MRRAILQIASMALAACTASEPLQLPVDSTARSLLFAIREGSEKARVFAYAPENIPPLSIGAEDLFLIAYPIELSALGLTPGEQPRPGDSEPARPFPPGYSAFRSDDDRESWTPVLPEDLDSALGDRVLVDLTTCESSGGCIRRIEEQDRQYCELPCQEPPDPIAPTEPSPPQLPDFSRCPTGWLSRPSLAADTTYCEPVALASCPAGSAHFLGDDGCTSISAACAQDGWPSALPSGRTVHFVRPGASGDGTSKASPFGTIAQAIAAASPQDVVALYAGAHAGGVLVDRPLAIFGACGDTAIAGGSPAVRIGASATVELSDLTIQPDGDGIEIQGNATLSGVTIIGGTHGVVVSGGLIADRLSITNASEGGLLGIEQSAIEVSRGDFADNVSYGARIEDRATARLTDVVVRGSLAHPGGEFERKGYGVLTVAQNPLVVTRALFERNRGNAIAAWYSSTASVTHAVDRDGLGDYSFDVDTEARGQASHLVSLRSSSGAVWAFRGGQATVSHVYASQGGGGLYARLGGVLIAERVLLEESSGVGVESSDGSNVTLSDLVIRDQSMSAADTGQGILVREAEVIADRVQIVRSTGQGIDVRGSATVQAAATLQDIRITGVRPRSPNTISFSCSGDGSGLRVRNNTSLTLRRAVFEGGARGIGIDSFDQHQLEHVAIRGAQRTGLCASNGTYDVQKLRIEEVSGIGLELFGGYMETSDLSVLGTKTLDDGTMGIGIHLWGVNNIMDVRVAILPLNTFLLSGNESRAIQMENGSQAMLRNGEIAGSEIGIELVNQPGFDLATLYDNVIFRNNRTLLMFR